MKRHIQTYDSKRPELGEYCVVCGASRDIYGRGPTTRWILMGKRMPYCPGNKKEEVE